MRRWIYPAALLLFVLVAVWIFTATTRFLLANIDRALEIQAPPEESARRINTTALEAVTRKLNISPASAPTETLAPETETPAEESETAAPPAPSETPTTEGETVTPLPE